MKFKFNLKRWDSVNIKFRCKTIGDFLFFIGEIVIGIIFAIMLYRFNFTETKLLLLLIALIAFTICSHIFSIKLQLDELLELAHEDAGD